MIKQVAEIPRLAFGSLGMTTVGKRANHDFAIVLLGAVRWLGFP